MAWIASRRPPRAAGVLLLGGCAVADDVLPGTWEGTAKLDDGAKLEVRVEVLAEEHPAHNSYFDPASPWRRHAVDYVIEGRASAEGLLSVCDGPERCAWSGGGPMSFPSPTARTVGQSEVLLLGMAAEEDLPCTPPWGDFVGEFHTFFLGELTEPGRMEGQLYFGPDSCSVADTEAALTLKRER